MTGNPVSDVFTLAVFVAAPAAGCAALTAVTVRAVCRLLGR